MELSYILTFVGGFLTDLVRKVLLPQSEEWIEGLIPSKRKEKNRDKNLLQLEVREKLQKMGRDASLADYLDDDADRFIARLKASQESKKEVFAQVEADRLFDLAHTQAEMNAAAFGRSEAADRLLETTYAHFEVDPTLTEGARAQLRRVQEAWAEFRDADAKLESLLLAEDGTMQPLIYTMTKEERTIDRIAQLKSMTEASLDG